MESAGAAVGALLVLGTWSSVLSVLVVPRRSRSRLNRWLGALVDGLFQLITWPIRRYDARDRVRSWQAPMSIIVQLAAWLALLYLGFVLLIRGVSAGSLRDAFAQAGSSLFTLGYAGPDSAPLTAVDYLAAASGLVVVALQIGYLPTLYGAFNRRETEVTLLSSRAGTPAWGPEILARTRFGFSAEDDGAVMTDFYLGWERWAADLAESHTNYPVLTRFRSPGPYASWLVALVAVMDSAALWLAVSPDRAPTLEARLALRTGFTTLRAIAVSLGLQVDEDPDPDSDLQLSYAEFLSGIDRIASTTFTMERPAHEAWPDFRGWRVNYETVAYALAERLDAVPAPWTRPRRDGQAAMEPIRPHIRRPTPYQADRSAT